MKYPVVLQSSDEGYSAHCPGLPGCWPQASTEDEAVANIRDAINEYLAVVTELTTDKIVREVERPPRITRISADFHS